MDKNDWKSGACSLKCRRALSEPLPYAGEKEGAGKFGKYYDIIEDDPLFGGKTWEEAESKMQHMAADIATAMPDGTEDIRYIVAGDLLGRCRDFVWIMNLNIPMFAFMVRARRWESRWQSVPCLWKAALQSTLSP